MNLNLSQKQSDAWHYLEDNETTEILYGGGAGGGKSWLGCLWHITRRVRYPGTRGLIGRAKLTVLKESTIITFFKVCDQLGYKSNVDYVYNATDHRVTWKNGSATIFKDLFLYPSDPDFTSLGSTEYTDAFIDECPEVTQKAVEIVNSRLRWMMGEYNLIPKTLLTANPQPGWVKERFIKDKEGSPVKLKPYQKFVQALVTDNPDQEFVKLYSSQLDKLTSDYDRQRLKYGDWDVEREVLNAFATQYDQKKHEAAEAIFDPNKQLLISIDFNLNPFAVIFAHMWRDQGEHFHIFDEATIDNGSVQAMIELIGTRYKNQLPTCILTGDAMGNRRQQGLPDLASFYTQLKRGLRLKDSQIRVPPNPLHSNSRADVNYVLYHFPDFKINPAKCPNTCLDMRTVQCDAFGEIIKKDRKDLSQRADHLDTVRYSINTFLKKWIDQHQKFGK